MRELFRYLSKYSKHLNFAISTSILNKILDLMPPLLVAWVIDTVSHQPPGWISSIIGEQTPFITASFLAALGFVIFGFESLFQWMYQLSFLTLSQKVQHELRLEAYQHLQKREMAFFENHRLGETMSILNEDVHQLEHFLSTGLKDIIQLVVVFVFAGIVLTNTSWQLALFSLTPIPIIIWGSLIYQRHISPKYAKLREAAGLLSARLENNIAGIFVVKSFTAEKFEYDRVQKASSLYKEKNYDAIKLNSVYVPLIRTVIAAGFSGVLLIGSYWVLNDSNILTIGQLVLFSMMIQRLLWPLTTIGVTLDEYERAKASIHRLFQFINTPSAITTIPTPKTLSSKSIEISFNDIDFSYTEDQPILRKLSLTIPSGQTIGVAGVTGAGKSTFIKLLLRLYDPKSGSITFNNTSISALSLEELRKNIALVSQDIYLFHGTILENIAYGLGTQDQEEAVISASKSAELHDFVMTLKDGYDTIIGERGIKLSGGQRQRLSIARAILKNAPIMVFDEATSSVDTETEREIQRNIHHLTKGKTGIIIAHRLSTIKHADRIIVLKNGQIIEDGTHDTLLQQGNTYSDLWNIQIGEA